MSDSNMTNQKSDMIVSVRYCFSTNANKEPFRISMILETLTEVLFELMISLKNHDPSCFKVTSMSDIWNILMREVPSNRPTGVYYCHKTKDPGYLTIGGLTFYEFRIEIIRLHPDGLGRCI